jgi:hypothetical protein
VKLRKQEARLKARQANAEPTSRDANEEGYHKPGSMNPHKSFPSGSKKRR